ncbi:MDR family MFS transporter [Micromonospora echinofusca]|uniref:MFS transporter n=1 Tax=Micromonospora echinofusca TaxID=47858 RepID=A0ABS3VRX8_MICEH|nr:MFS transporter [Micromonospora echinofusca]MBO4207255.1 MFS transporter [Micromonospora echinofusca]
MRFRALAGVRSSAAAAFGGLPGGFWWLWIAQLTNRAASFVVPLLAFYVTDELHRSAALAGTVVAAIGVGALASGPLGGVLSDRLGHKPTLVGALAATAVSLVALPYARSSWALLLGAFVVGVVSNATRPAFNALIAEVIPPADRNRAYSLNFWAINIGYSVAMLSVGLVSITGYTALFWLDGATTMISALLIATRVARPRPSTEPTDATEGRGIGAVLRDRTFLALVAAQFLVLTILAQSESGLPIAMDNDGFSPGEFGRLAALNGIVIVVVQLPLTRYLQRFGDAWVLAGSSAVIGVGYSLLLFGSSAWIYALSIVVWTLGEIGNTPTSIALVSRISPAHLRGRYQGVYQVAWTGSSVLGPLIGGWTIYTWGAAPLWCGCLVVGLAAAAAQLRIGARLGRRAEIVVPVRPEPESATT